MPKGFGEKIEELRLRLMGDLSVEELQRMQLHLDALERWARLATSGDHDHDDGGNPGEHDHEHGPELNPGASAKR